jgi:hypothetical protein
MTSPDVIAGFLLGMLTGASVMRCLLAATRQEPVEGSLASRWRSRWM